LFETEKGHLVITPFILSNGKGKILVNRGWISNKQRLDPSLRKETRINGLVEVVGILRTTSEKPSLWQMIMNNPTKKEWRYRDLKGMSNDLDTLPILIEVNRECSDSLYPGGPIGGQSFLDMSNNYKQFEWIW